VTAWTRKRSIGVEKALALSRRRRDSRRAETAEEDVSEKEDPDAARSAGLPLLRLLASIVHRRRRPERFGGPEARIPACIPTTRGQAELKVRLKRLAG